MKRSTMSNKLDKLFSEVVRSRGVCERCGITDKSKLQCAHIYSRTFKSVRWNLLNALSLCQGCHFWGHKNPILFTEFVQKKLGNDYEILKSIAVPISKWTMEELQEIYDELKNESK